MDPYNLRQFPLFRDLSEEEIINVTSLAHPLDYRSTETVFRRNDPADAFYLIQAGTVRFSIPATNDEAAKQVILREGQFFGEIGLIRDVPRTADAHADKFTKLLRFNRNAFIQMMNGNPKLAKKVAQAIRDRLNEYSSDASGERSDVKAPKVLSFLSTGMQEGATFIAANIAMQLHLNTKQPVLAAELNFEGQSLPHYLETMTDLGSYDPFITDEEITPETVRRAAANLPNGVSLLSGYGAEMHDAFRPRHAGEMIRNARDAFEYVVIDPGYAFDPMRAEAAHRVDVAHVICAPTEESIDRADKVHAWLEGQGLEGRVRFILNRVPDDPEVDPKVIQEVLGADLLGSVVNSPLQPKTKGQMCEPIVTAVPDSPVAKDIKNLCRTIQNTPAEKQSGFANLIKWTLGFD
jgi:CRP-like cAMP-binding protein